VNLMLKSVITIVWKVFEKEMIALKLNVIQ